MSCFALVTFDLIDCSQEQRENFYKELQSEKKYRTWQRILEISTAFTLIFNEAVSYEDAEKLIVADLNYVRKSLQIKEVKYAFVVSTKRGKKGRLVN